MSYGDPLSYNYHLGAESVAPFSTDECQCPYCSTRTENAYPPIQAISDAPPLSPDIRNPQPAYNSRKIIAFTGVAGSGKSTAAQYLVERHGFERVRFAGRLKDMMRALGLSEREIEGDLKEKPCALLAGKTPRYAMQTIGTEWGRDIIDHDLWVRVWADRVAKLPAGKPVVVDDCRFPNEAATVRALGGNIVRIMRPGAGTSSAHLSETHTHEMRPDITLRNDASLEMFLSYVEQVFCDLSWIQAR